MKKKLYRIGITGGIASGKSNLLKYLHNNVPGIYTVNLDLYGHQVYQKNPIVVRNIATIFGKDCVTLDPTDQNEISSVNRQALGVKVFSSPQKLAALSQLVSPEIKRMLVETIREVEQSEKYDIITVEGAVLIEARTYPMFDEMWVTTLEKEQAVQRVLKRNPELSEGQARARVYAQIDDEERLKYASFHYDTSDLTPFEENVRIIEEKLQTLREKGLLRKSV